MQYSSLAICCRVRVVQKENQTARGRKKEIRSKSFQTLQVLQFWDSVKMIVLYLPLVIRSSTCI